MYFILRKIFVIFLFLFLFKNNVLSVVIVGKINDVGYFLDNSLNNVFYIYNKNYLNYIAVDVYFSNDDVPFVISDLTKKTNVAEFYLYKKRDDNLFYLEDFTAKEIEKIKLIDNLLLETNFNLIYFSDLINVLDGLNKSIGKNVGIIVRLPDNQKIDTKKLKNIIKMIEKYDFVKPENGYMIWVENLEHVQMLTKELKFEGRVILSNGNKFNSYGCVFFKKKCSEKEFLKDLEIIEEEVKYVVIDINDFVKNSINLNKSFKLLKILKDKNIEVFFDNKMKNGVNLDKLVGYLKANLLRGVISSNFVGEYFLDKLKNDF